MNTDDKLFSLLSQEPGTGVSVLDRDARLLYINDEAIRMFFGDETTSADIVGKDLHEMGFPDEWIKERMDLIREIEQTGQEILLRTIWHGLQQFSWMRSLCDDNDAPFRVLVVTRRVSAGAEAERLLLESEMPVIQSQVTGLGELKELTRRELEVLALIGQGLTAKEIAELMHRSVKTVENHRIALGAKLKKSNKVELALMARAAGLKVEDSDRQRVR